MNIHTLQALLKSAYTEIVTTVVHTLEAESPAVVLGWAPQPFQFGIEELEGYWRAIAS